MNTLLARTANCSLTPAAAHNTTRRLLQPSPFTCTAASSSSSRRSRCHSRGAATTCAAAVAAGSSTKQQQPIEQQHQQQQQQPNSLQQPLLLLGSAAAALLLLSDPAAAAAADTTTSTAQQLALVADLDAAAAHSLESVLRPLFAAFTVLYIIRIPMTWYPTIDGTKLPWLLAYGPTEPFLKLTRNVIPLVGGVDVTPIVWVALISFFNEILLGPQGILMLIQRESGAGLL